uniref:Uncharacterized protein n=1 Tax=Panagrolaimus davidi TaxID=227884 RepID=A0A914PAU2_9BILA
MIVKGNILVTGANRGIGFSFVKHLCLLNTVERVFAGCRSPENATDLIKLQKTNSKIKIIKLDIQNDLCIQLAAEQISYEIGENEGINCLINNAGVLEMVGFFIF